MAERKIRTYRRDLDYNLVRAVVAVERTLGTRFVRAKADDKYGDTSEFQAIMEALRPAFTNTIEVVLQSIADAYGVGVIIKLMESRGTLADDVQKLCDRLGEALPQELVDLGQRPALPEPINITPPKIEAPREPFIFDCAICDYEFHTSVLPGEGVEHCGEEMALRGEDQP